MADFALRPSGDTDWSNAIFLSGSLPVSDLDIAAAGLTIGASYQIARLTDEADLGLFTATALPGQMAAPALAADGQSLTVTLAADPADNGAPITSHDLRYSPDGAAWNTVTGITSPQDITGLAAHTEYQVQTRAVNANGAGGWSGSATETTGTDQAAPSASVSAGTQQGNGDIDITVTDLSLDAPDSYFILTATAQTTLTSAQVRAGNDETGAAAADGGTLGLTQASPTASPDLAAGLDGDYYLHIVFGSAQGAYSDPYSLGPISIDTTVTSSAISLVGTAQIAGAANTTDDSALDISGIGLAQGDLVLAFVSTCSGTLRTPSVTSAGWSLLTPPGDLLYEGGGGKDTNLSVYYKIMGASPDSTVDWASGGYSNDSTCLQIRAYRGVDGTTPFDGVTPVATGATDTGLCDPGAISPATAGAWVAVFGASASDVGAPTSLANPGDLTGPLNDAHIGTDHCGAWVSGDVENVSGSHDGAAWSFASGADSSGYSNACVAIALRPTA